MTRRKERGTHETYPWSAVLPARRKHAPVEGIWGIFQFHAGVVNSHLYH
jgi:hypothetical protein